MFKLKKLLLPAKDFRHSLILALTRASTKGNRTFLMGKIYEGSVWYFFLVAFLLKTPHHLSYFNGLTGGPKNGHKYLLDSNLDWGQDLPSLKELMDERKIDKVHLAYFGTAWPEPRAG